MIVEQSALLSRVINVLTDFPSPQSVLALSTTPDEERRLDELTNKNGVGNLTRSEARELDEYLIAEHLVRMAKINAHQRLKE